MMTRRLSVLDIAIIIVLIIVAAIVIYLLAPLIIAIAIIAAGYFIYCGIKLKVHGHSAVTRKIRQLLQ
jgi:predicted RND superfamily exporter protein